MCDPGAWETETGHGPSWWEDLIFVVVLIGVLGIPLWVWMAS